MFPYRRNVKKRTKNGPQPGKGAQQTGQGQRMPGSARELLRLLQPTTKALAQLLAGNAQPSGQLGHARQLLDQAQWLVEDHQVERLSPSEREEFLEQFARLKLTIGDARDLEHEYESQGGYEAEEQRTSRPAIAPERLREMALALSSATPATPPKYSGVQPAAPVYEAPEPTEPVPATDPSAAEPDDTEEGRSGPRGQRLRLKRTTPLDVPLA